MATPAKVLAPATAGTHASAIKTLHLTNAWHSKSGGISTFYRAMLRRAESEGRYMRLIVPAEEDRVEETGRYGRIYHLASAKAPLNPEYRMLYPAHYLSAKGAVRRILAEEQPDLIEISDKYTLPYLGGLLRQRWLPGFRKRPVVVGLSCERMDSNIAAYLTRSQFAVTLSRFYLKWLYFPLFDHHLAVSGHVAEELRQAARGHKCTRGVWLCPMGVDLEHFSPGHRDPAVRARLLEAAGAGAEKLLLYAGRLAPEKNLELLIETMEQLAGTPSLRLLIAGSGNSREALESAASRRIPGRYAFLGHVAGRSELASILSNCDVFLHPNPNEPFGIAPLEAMASGLPLVAPDSGGVVSYANGANAWLAPATGSGFAGAVSAVIANPGELRRRTAAARQTAESLNWETAASNILALYDELYRRTLGMGADPRREPEFYSTSGDWLGFEQRERLNISA